MPSLKRMFLNKFFVPAQPPSDTSFTNQTILLTGATAGIGYSVAVKLLQHGCRSLILGVRSVSRGEEAKSRMVQDANLGLLNKEEDELKEGIRVWEVDQASFKSVKEFARRIEKDLPGEKLHAAVLNAAVIKGEWHETKDGWEETLQVNALGTALLGLLLLPKLLESARSLNIADSGEIDDRPRLLFVSSGGVREADSTTLKKSPDGDGDEYVLKRLNAKEGFDGRPRYEISKLLMEYAMIHISQLPIVSGSDGPKVIVNSVYPGSCVSRITRDTMDLESLIARWLMPAMLRSAEEGARSVITGLRLGVESQGRYWWNDELADRGPNVDSDEGKELSRKMWKEMLEILNNAAPEIKESVRSSE